GILGDRPRPGGRSATARGHPDRVQRLGLHGQQGLRRRVRPRTRTSARACRPRNRGGRRGRSARQSTAVGGRMGGGRRILPGPGRAPFARCHLRRTYMKILMVSWEYPPVVVGGLGRHVHHLATELAAAGHEVVVLARRPTGTDPSTHPTHSFIEDGVLVVAVAEDPPAFDFGEDMLAWTLAMGLAMVRAGIGLRKPGIGEGWTPDVVHAHDWLVAQDRKSTRL